MLRLDIFCNVIDNYGDAGVCLHLARTLSQQGFEVKLRCDQIAVLEKILNRQDLSNPKLQIKPWLPFTQYTCPEVIINAFNCRLDPVILKAIQQRALFNSQQAHSTTQKPSSNTSQGAPQEPSPAALKLKAAPLVINLDYLSAEDWIEGCHGLTSFADGITCYYYFPGFTAKTGGLNVEPEFIARCQEHLAKLSHRLSPLTVDSASLTASTAATALPAAQATAHQAAADSANSDAATTYPTVSLFSYANPALMPLLHGPACFKIFAGLALDNVNQLLQLSLAPGERHELPGKLTLEALNMVQQSEYDQILLGSTCNLVRGEDSIIRAMHTGNPFLWQIYKQEENAHILKLESFLKRMHTVLVEQYAALAPDQTARPFVTAQAADPSVTQAAAPSEPADSPAPITHAAYLLTEKWEEDFAYLKQCMLAYNEAAAWPEHFSLEQFLIRTQAMFYHFAAYLCRQEPLSLRLTSFIYTKLGLTQQ